MVLNPFLLRISLLTLPPIEPVTDFRVSLLMAEVSWKAFGREWRISLSLSSVAEGNTEHFLGSLKGEASAIVSVSLMLNGTVRAMIITANETYWLGPLLNATAELGIYMYRCGHTGQCNNSFPCG